MLLNLMKAVAVRRLQGLSPAALTALRLPGLFLGLALLLGAHGGAEAIIRREVVEALTKASRPSPVAVPAAGSLEVGFSPGGSAEALVLKVIHSAKYEVRVMAYSFTAAKVVDALRQARHRGVEVYVIADRKANVSGDDRGKGRAALSTLVNAGAQVRIVDAYAIHHDKVLIVDGSTVQTGSYNYSAAAARSNSENVLVNWNNPGLANVYQRHFARNWSRGVPMPERE
jgi:phosphatidylserine/phosphatidylglycerophosphate/cardiolipin synthase-like enzyme